MERLFPDFQSMDPDEIYEDLSFPEVSWDRPYIAFNMVTSVDGKATQAGRAYPLGSKVDHQLMRHIRVAADAVMVGAETLRTEAVNPSVPPDLQAIRIARGLTSQPTAIVITESGDLPLDRGFFQNPVFPKVVIVSESTPAARVSALEPHAWVIKAGREGIDLPLAMRVLASQLGIRRLLVEGGPRTNAALLSQGMGEELFWTVAPKILGGTATKSMVEGSPLPLDRIARLELASLHHHEGELYLRYRVIR